MTVTHADVVARLDGRPMSAYPDAVAWRAHAWLVDCIDADAAKAK